MASGHPRRLWRSLFSLCVCVLLAPVLARAQTPPQAGSFEASLADARRSFDALDYERAIPALDALITQLELRSSDATLKPTLAAAYELRARARFGTADSAGARSDFRAMLIIAPSYALPAQVSPRVVALFNEVKKATIGTVKIAVNPPEAELELDGAPFVSNGQPVSIPAGSHTIAGKRVGYSPSTEMFDVPAGGAIETTLTLERVSATVAIVTSPPDVEVWMDGIARGKTPQGPATQEFAEWPAKLGVSAAAISRPLLLADLQPGAHLVEFRGPCLVRTERRVEVLRPADYVLDPVKVDRAVAAIQVTVTQPSARVFVDGSPRGAAPVTLNDVCEGPHVVEVRSLYGRLLRRLDVRTGQTLTVNGNLSPAFAVVSASGLPPGLRGGPDLRLSTERALQSVRTITVFAPAAEQVDPLLAAEQLPPGWLAFDKMKRPIGESVNITSAARRELSAKLSTGLDVQGIAAVTVQPQGNQNDVLLTLLAAGSGEPDILELNLDRPDATAASLARLDQVVTLFRPSVGLSTIDVLDVPGAVVVSADANGAGAKAGVAPGDVIVTANGKPITSAGEFNATVSAAKAGDKLSIESRDRAGAPKRSDLGVDVVPRLIAMADQTLLFNKLVVDFRSKLGTPTTPTEESVTRLNLAVALMRLGNWADAKNELDRVKLDDGTGVSTGTVQYLTGLCSEALGDLSEAQRAWQAAAQSQSGITEDGPPVKELATRKLADLQRRTGPGAR
jgi:PDZ domain-containing protein/PEGA domain-containing protein